MDDYARAVREAEQAYARSVRREAEERARREAEDAEYYYYQQRNNSSYRKPTKYYDETAQAIHEWGRENPKAAATTFGSLALLGAALYLFDKGGFEAVAWPGLCFFVYDFSVARYFGAKRRSALMISAFLLLGFAALYCVAALSSSGSAPGFFAIVSGLLEAGVGYVAHNTLSFILALALGVVMARINLRLTKCDAPLLRCLLIAVPVLVAMFALHGYYKIIVIAGSFVLSSLVFYRGHCDIYREKHGNLELGTSYMLHMLAVAGVMAIFSWLFL